MRLKTGVVHSLFVVLTSQLDGYEQVVKNKDGEGRITTTMFELGAVRLVVAVNANKLKPIVQGFEEANSALIKGLTGGKTEISQKDNPDGFQKYQDELKSMMEVEHEVDLAKIKRADLKLNVNPIPVQSLMILEESGLLID